MSSHSLLLSLLLPLMQSKEFMLLPDMLLLLTQVLLLLLLLQSKEFLLLPDMLLLQCWLAAAAPSSSCPVLLTALGGLPLLQAAGMDCLMHSCVLAGSLCLLNSIASCKQWWLRIVRVVW
jgi:hypothetical protein